jgi:hypothetical protein
MRALGSGAPDGIPGTIDKLCRIRTPAKGPGF